MWRVEDWQLEVVGEVFAGAAETWLLVAEGNGKTTLMSGLGLYHGDYTPSAAALIAASAREQAEVLFEQAAGFVERTPSLGKRFKVFRGYRHVRCLRSAGTLKVKAADDRTGDGVIPSLLLVDELHRHRDLKLYRTWRGKLAKRGGQMIAISTAGEPGSEFENAREQLRAHGEYVSPGHLRAQVGRAVLHDYHVPAGLDFEDLGAVKLANPLSTVTEDVLREKRDSPTGTPQHFQRFVCNQAVRPESSAVNEREWLDARASSGPRRGEPCVAGLDVGWKWDTTALVPLFDRRDHVLVGGATILEPPRDGSSLSPDAIRSALADLHDRHPFELLVIDGAAGGEQLAEWAELELGAQVVVHSNGNAAQALAYRRWMEGLREGSLLHTGDPVLTEHVLNAAAKLLPLGDHRFVRQSSSRHASLQDRRVIDGLSAASAALSVLIAARQEPAPVPVRAAFL